ncbi:hypothetical protein ABTY63_29995 [Streptomyces solisilvae]|uniref:hypothetical protein n=1 Tax=Streptomyces malaysiensis TaxID=92644 RepID=UPI003322E14F
MDARTMTLLVIIAVIVGCVAYVHPGVGVALVVAVTVVAFVYMVFKDDDERNRRQ